MPKDVAVSLGPDVGKRVHEVDGVGGKVKMARASVRMKLEDGQKTRP